MTTKAKLKEEEQDRMLLELSCVETAVPAQMLWLMAASVVSKGYVLREDMRTQLNNAAAVPLAALGTDFVAIQRAASRVEDNAQKLLFKLSPDNPVHGLYAVAAFCLKIVEEGYFSDATNMSVLCSLALYDELKEHGGVESYTFKERILAAEADKLLKEAQALGLYRVQLIAQRRDPVPSGALN